MTSLPRVFAALSLSLLAACTGAMSTADPSEEGDDGSGGDGGAPAGRAGSGGRGGAPGPIETPSCDSTSLAPKIAFLTPAQHERALAAVLPLDGEPPSEALAATHGQEFGYSNDAAVKRLSIPHTQAQFDLAKRLVTSAVERPGVLEACLLAATPDAACVRRFVESVGRKAFRRPLEAAETDRYVAAFEAERKASSSKAAAATVLRAFVLSPWFLFRTELGGSANPSGAVELTAWERASALSFILQDGPPDADLQRAAEAGELARTEGVAMQARRLLAQPGSAPGLLRFLGEYFRTREAPTRAKDPKQFPGGRPEIVLQAMADESQRFAAEVLWKDDGRLGTLLSAPYSMLDDALAQHYGVAMAAGSGFRKTAVPTGERAGILTHGSIWSVIAKGATTDVVHRGLYVRQRLLCQDVPRPDPATAAMIKPIEDDGKTTGRQRSAQHAQGGCAACHKLIDPLAFPYEVYDGFGRHRTEENGQRIDPSGAIVGTKETDGDVKDAIDLGRKLAASNDVLSCFAVHMRRYLTAGLETEADACEVERFFADARSVRGDVREMALRALTSNAFLTRRATNP